jgi:hypothetical protein
MYLNLPAFYLGVKEELDKVANLLAKARPSATKIAPIASKIPASKPAAMPDMTPSAEMPYAGSRATLTDLASFPITEDDFMRGGGRIMFRDPANPAAQRPAIAPAVSKQGLPANATPAVLPKKPLTIKKKAGFDSSSMPVNENILPNITNQAKWKYVRTKDGLKLTDGNLVYSFGGFPKGYPGEDLRVARTGDDNILDFDKDAITKGTAQIHRSSPDNIYMTLADGSNNPTFMLQHEEGKSWRYSPSKKFLEKLKRMGDAAKVEQPIAQEAQDITPSSTMLIDPESFKAGAEAYIKQSAYNPYTGQGHGMDAPALAESLKNIMEGTQDFASQAVDFAGEHPIATALGGYLAAKGGRGIKRMLSDEQPASAGGLKDELLPIAAGAFPALAGMAIKAE